MLIHSHTKHVSLQILHWTRNDVSVLPRLLLQGAALFLQFTALKCPFDGPFTALKCPFDGPFTALKCPFQMAPCPFENLGRTLDVVVQCSFTSVCQGVSIKMLGAHNNNRDVSSFQTCDMYCNGRKMYI